MGRWLLQGSTGFTPVCVSSRVCTVTRGAGGLIHDDVTMSITILYSLQEFPNLQTKLWLRNISHLSVHCRAQGSACP